MAKKTNKAKTAVTVTLRGGPKDRERLQICNPQPPLMRFALPEWCTYRQSTEKPQEYVYESDLEFAAQEMSAHAQFPYDSTAW